MESPPVNDRSRKRRRLPVSCAECRHRKLKCDQMKPCSQCTNAGRELKCAYTDSHDPSHFPRQITKTRFRHVHFESTRPTVQRPPESREPGARPVGTADPTPPKDKPKPSVIVAERHGILASGMEHLQGKDGRTRLFPRSHWGGLLASLEDVRAFMSNGARKLELRDADYMSLKVRDPGSFGASHDALEALDDLIPSHEISNELVTAYLSNYETVHRILHIPTFLRQYGSFWESPRDTRPVFKATLLAVMAVGYSLAETKPQPDTLARVIPEWISSVDRWASSVPQRATFCIEYIQLQCLLLLCREVHALDADIPWVRSSSVVRTAMMMGLHREPSVFAHVSPFYAEIRRRLWYTVVELDLQVAVTAGMPPSVDLARCACRYPMNIHDDELSEDASAGDLVSKGLSVCTRTAFQIVLLQSLPLRTEIANAAAMPPGPPPDESIISLDTKLTEWYSSTPDYCRSRTASLPLDIGQSCAIPSQILTLTYYGSLLILHSPFMACDKGSAYSQQQAVRSATQILSQVQRQHLDAPFSRSIARLSGEIVRDRVLHAGIVLCLELLHGEASCGPEQRKITGSYSRHQEEVLEALESADAYFIHHLKRGLCTPKQFLFLRMAVASAKARLHRDSPLHAVKDTFRAAVRECKSYYAALGSQRRGVSPMLDAFAAGLPEEYSWGPLLTQEDVSAMDENPWSTSLFEELMAEFDAQQYGAYPSLL